MTRVRGLQYVFFIGCVSLYFLLSGPALQQLGWDYLGQGGELEKLHPATYLIVACFSASCFIDPQFRTKVLSLIGDPIMVGFGTAVLATGTYASAVHGASITPFVDTFFAAILSTIVLLSMPGRYLLVFGTIIDLFLTANIILLFIEYFSGANIIPVYDDPGGNGNQLLGLYTRSTALLGFPLEAATVLGAYSVTKLISIDVRYPAGAVMRLFLVLTSCVGILTTGGRTAFFSCILVIFLYFAASLVSSIFSGKVPKNAIPLAGIGIISLIIVAPVLVTTGVMNVFLDRLEDDIGSSLSREYAIAFVTDARLGDLWFGLPISDVFALQKSYGLIAIEVSWINFILVCGLFLALPLFLSFCAFLFYYLPKHCNFSVIFTSVFILIVTASFNGLWSKTLVLTISCAIAVSFLRKDIAENDDNVFGPRKVFAPPRPQSRSRIAQGNAARRVDLAGGR
jgi:hypothetical protein